MFSLYHGDRHFHASGLAHRLQAGPAETLEERVRGYFSARPGAAPLVGALPFDRSADDYLYEPLQAAHEPQAFPFPLPGAEQAGWAPIRIDAEPQPAAYAAMVAQALKRIAAGELEKLVLSRSLRIETSAPVDAQQVVARLARDPDVMAYLVDLPAPAGTQRTLVGATPELLVSRHGAAVVSHPLAGSAARSGHPTQDRLAAEALLASAKDRREHGLVVESILDLLAPFCSELATPEGVALRHTSTMWHLGTRIEGRLKADAPSSAGLAALLHPTPAVGGSPRAAALAAIRELEPQDRGFYAGAIGWTDAAGDGEWHVTLRCAEISGTGLKLHAGAGIVAGSVPESEVAETGAKFRAMLRALDMDETHIKLDDAA